jgi:ribonuclease VapC
MVLDTSVIVAIIGEEAGAQQLFGKVKESPVKAVGAPTLVEAGMVLTSKLQDRARPIIDEFLRRTGVEVVPFTDEHYRVAVSAFQRYGKGRHPAALNFGDCLSYAVARLSGMPLLFTGDDFSKTDIPRAK